LTNTRKKELQSKMRRLCREAIATFADEHNLKTERFDGQTQIVGPEGFITDRPHGDSLDSPGGSDFEPGFGTEEDWEKFFALGVVLGWVHMAPTRTGDNFYPKDKKEALSVLKMIGLKAS
jgi:hypothetical protein